MARTVVRATILCPGKTSLKSLTIYYSPTLIKFEKDEAPPTRDSEGYPLKGVDEVDSNLAEI